jgi:SM-20-related protein
MTEPAPSLFALNPAHDLAALAAAYRVKQRLQIKNALTPESAERIYAGLAGETPWGLVYNKGREVIEVPRDKLVQMTPDEMRAVYTEVYGRARDSYQFIYNYYPILTSFLSGENRGFFLHRVLEALNAEPMLDFIRRLTGLRDVVKADAQATLYRGSHFLHQHDDEEKPEGRRCAYVLNFTKDWRPNWGGYLQFYDAQGNVEEALKPIFNALHVFTVPQIHSVGFVTPYCQGQRFAITGWFRNK